MTKTASILGKQMETNHQLLRVGEQDVSAGPCPRCHGKRSLGCELCKTCSEALEVCEICGCAANQPEVRDGR